MSETLGRIREEAGTTTLETIRRMLARVEQAEAKIARLEATRRRVNGVLELSIEDQPTRPGAGIVRLYVRDNGSGTPKVYATKPDGTEVDLEATGSGGVTDGDKGDITVTGSGGTWTIDANAVTFAKMQAISADVLLGNDASGTAVEQISCTAAGRAIIDDADASAQRTTLGLGALATVTPGTGVATFLTTPSSANLASALTDETGSGAAVFATGPTFNGATFNTSNVTCGAGILIDGVDVGAHDHSDSTNQTRLAAKDRRRMITFGKGADALPGTATAETAMGKAPPDVTSGSSITHTAAYYVPSAALTADNANYATIIISRYTSAGASKTTLYSKTTQTSGSGGTGNWTAFAPVSLGTVANAAQAADGSISFEITKTGTGVTIPRGAFVVEYTVD